MQTGISLRQALASRRTLLSIAFMVFSALLWVPANALIQWLYPGRPAVPDLLFTLTPEVRWLAYATDPILFGSIAIILVQALRVDRRRLPFYFSAAAVLYCARAVLMILTPLGRPTGNGDSYGILEFSGVLQHGMFPSGHQALACLAFFLVDGAKAPRMKRLALMLAVLQGAALILSRGHYSIDVVGGALVAWFVTERLSRVKDRFDLL
ncbi:MAG: phosphatase PAP2-related protein [Spirochaetes bacterium]|nr:phosphatase PAP2-related protein [Spirochaetota bacterium]